MGGACGTYRERRSAYRIMVAKFQGKNPLRRPKGRWEDNV
jgi:hypothetical protein